MGTHIVRCKGTNFFAISQILYTFFITFLHVYWHKGRKGEGKAEGASPLTPLQRARGTIREKERSGKHKGNKEEGKRRKGFKVEWKA